MSGAPDDAAGIHRQIAALDVTASTADQLRAARAYIWRECRPEWLDDVLAAMGITTEGTTT